MRDAREEWSGHVPTRRKFLAWGLWGIMGMLAAASAWPVVGLVTRRTARKRLAYFKALQVDEMPESGIKKVELSLRGGDKPDMRVFIRREASGALTAFSAACTHLGCLVNYNRMKGEFICPCHGGRYGPDGDVLGGPPIAPLAKLPVKAEGRDIFVGFMV